MVKEFYKKYYVLIALLTALTVYTSEIYAAAASDRPSVIDEVIAKFNTQKTALAAKQAEYAALSDDLNRDIEALKESAPDFRLFQLSLQMVNDLYESVDARYEMVTVIHAGVSSMHGIGVKPL